MFLKLKHNLNNLYNTIIIRMGPAFGPSLSRYAVKCKFLFIIKGKGKEVLKYYSESSE